MFVLVGDMLTAGHEVGENSTEGKIIRQTSGAGRLEEPPQRLGCSTRNKPARCMSAMVSSGMRRKRLPSREREASMGMSARARAMISLGCGVAGLFTLQSSGPLGMSGIRWGFQITSFHGAAVATLPAGCIGPRQAERYSAAASLPAALRVRQAISMSVDMISPKVR